MNLSAWIRDIPDFPKPGVGFKDITPLLADASAFAAAIAQMAHPFGDAGIQQVCAIEARGFIFGGAIAQHLGCGFVPLRKPGKLPARTISIDYALEYGSDRLEVHADTLAGGARVLIVDDVLATGGTLAAAADLLERAGAQVAGAAVLVELAFLGGRARWSRAAPLHSILRYD